MTFTLSVLIALILAVIVYFVYNARDSGLRERIAELEEELKKAGKRDIHQAENSENFQRLLDNAAEVVVVVQDEKICFINTKVDEITGYRGEELKEKPFFHIIDSKYREEVLGLYRKLVDGNDIPGIYDFGFQHKSGERRWARMKGFRILWNGQPAVLAFINDITEIKRIEKENRSNLYFLEKLEKINDSIRTNVDLERMMNEVLETTLSIFQADRAWLLYPCDPNALTWRVPMLVARPEYDLDSVVKTDIPMIPETSRLMEEFLDSEEPLVFNGETKRKIPDDASRFGVKSQLNMAIYPRIGSPWVFGIHMCRMEYNWNAEQKRLFREIGLRIADALSNVLFLRNLWESEEKYRALIEATETGYCIVDDKGRVIDANEEYVRLTGHRERNDIAGRCFLDWTAEEEKEKNWEVFETTLKKGHIKWFEVEYRGPENEGTPVEINAATLESEKGFQVMVLCRDISRRKNIERERIRMEKKLHSVRKFEALGRLAGGVAHDFNNLMMGIQGNVSLALLEMPSTHPAYQRMKNIEDYLKSSTELTRQLLGFARGGSQTPEVTNLNELLKKNSGLFQRTKKDIVIRTDFQKDLWAVRIDRNQIDQVFFNIYINARQAMPDGAGNIEITTRNVNMDDADVKPYNIKGGWFVKASVSDDGKGMDFETMNRIFEPFFTTKKDGTDSGTGLGLASAYGIVKNHGGFITVYSEPGKGSTFNVYLPVASEKVAEIKQVDEGGILKGEGAILLIDDEEMILEIGREILEKLGYTPFIAESGSKAIEIFSEKKEKIDLVILDMIMPDMNGKETFNRLQEIDADVKVILASGYAKSEQALDILSRGGRGFIRKPFTLKELSEKIQEVLQ